MEIIDFDGLRAELDDLRARAEKLLERLDREKNADACGLFDRFVSAVEELIASRESDLDKVKKLTHLKRFFDIVAPDDIKEDFEQFKDELSELLAKEALSGEEKKFELFVSKVDNPKLELSAVDDETLDAFNDYFRAKFTRRLDGGAYHFASDTPSQNNEKIIIETTDGGKILPEDSIEQISSTQQTNLDVEKNEEIEKIEEKFVFTNPQKDSHFGAKAFKGDYFNEERSGTNYPKIGKFGELNLLGYFAQFGALTRRQLKDYLFKFNMSIWNPDLENVCKKGYVTNFRRKDSDVEFYALSSNGLKIFETKTTRDLMKGYLEFWSGKKPLCVNSELIDISSDIKSYERTATVALKILSSGYVRVRTSVVARIRDNTKMAAFELSLDLVDKTKISFFLRGTPEKVFISPLIECSKSEHIDTTDCLYCVVSDDHTVEYFDSDDRKIDFNAFIKKLNRFKTEVPTNNKEPEDALDMNVDVDEEACTAHDHDDDSGADAIADEDKHTGEKSEIVSDTGVVVGKKIPTDNEPDTCYGTDSVTDETIFATGEIYEEALGADLPSDTFAMARSLLENNITPSNKGAFDKLVDSLLDAASDAVPEDNTDYIGRAVVLRKTLALFDEKKYGQDYKRLRLATDMPLNEHSDEHIYSYGELSRLFYNENEVPEEVSALHLAALLRTLFRPSPSWEHDLHQLTDYAKGLLDVKKTDDVFSKLPDLKNVLNTFTEIISVLPNGFTDAVISRFIAADVKATIIERLKTEVKDMCKLPNIQYFPGAQDMMKKCFGPKSDFGQCMNIIANDKTFDKIFILNVYNSLTDDDKNSPKKIEKFIDNAWEEIRRGDDKVKIRDFKLGARKKTILEINQRLDTMKKWLAYVDGSSAGHSDKVKNVYEEVSKSLDGIVERLQKDISLPKSDRAVLLRAVKDLSLLIKGENRSLRHFLLEDWLAVGIFPISNEMPIINETFCDVLYYEPWRNALRHISYKPGKLTDVLEQINSPNSRLYDNIGQAIEICDYLELDNEKYKRSITNAQEHAEKLIRDFEEKSGLDWFYGRIGDDKREFVIGELEHFKPEFLENQYFALLLEFLDALREQLADEQKEKEKHWKTQIMELENRGRLSDGWKECFYEHLKNSDFLLVEEAINVFDNGGDPSQVDLNLDEEEDLFSEFIGNRYKELEEFCEKNSSEKLIGLKSLADKYIDAEVAGEHRDSAKKLLMSLPNQYNETYGDGSRNIETLLKELGFSVTSVTRENPKQEPARFTAKVEPERKNRPSYKHPIAAMGTNLGNAPLYVIELFGKSGPHSIIDTVRKQETMGMPLVFLNGYLTGIQRRQLAKIFFEHNRRDKPFVFVDWILLLHLASQDKADRIRVMLACAMPFTGAHQLFSADSRPVDDEMYIGRAKEIQKIREMKGPNFVYGGRQLGKTAILTRARNLFHDPQKDQYGVCVDYNKEPPNETSFVNSLNNEMKKVGISLTSSGSIKDLCTKLEMWLTQKKSRQLLLLIDESDDILHALAKNRYAALAEFEKLKNNTGRFKFVFAGLHNVFLAANDENNIFGHFSSICIPPLERSDAYKLLTRPLRVLGFKPNPQTLLPLLVNTVFYPGVVHFVGEKLVDMLIDNYSDHYIDSENPPYQLENKQISSIMYSEKLSKMVGDRIKWTLKVDTSYYLLALYIAGRYYLYEEQNCNGYSIEEILESAKMLETDTWQEMTKEECENLLSELCDMSILAKINSKDVKNEADGRYRFRLSRFLKIVGKSLSDVEEQIKQCHEQEKMDVCK